MAIKEYFKRLLLGNLIMALDTLWALSHENTWKLNSCFLNMKPKPGTFFIHNERFCVFCTNPEVTLNLMHDGKIRRGIQKC